MIALEITADDSLFAANGFAITIKELHTYNVERLERMLAMRRSREEVSAAAITLLALNFGLCKLAVRAAQLQSAAESATYAREFWTKIVTFN